MHKSHCWALIVYKDTERTKVARVYKMPTMRAVGKAVAQTGTTVSNWYHGLTKRRGDMVYIDLIKVRQWN